MSDNSKCYEENTIQSWDKEDRDGWDKDYFSMKWISDWNGTIEDWEKITI